MSAFKVVLFRVLLLIITTYVPFYLVPKMPNEWYLTPTIIILFFAWAISVGLLVKPID